MITSSNPSGCSEFTFRSDLLLTARGGSTWALLVAAVLSANCHVKWGHLSIRDTFGSSQGCPYFTSFTVISGVRSSSQKSSKFSPKPQKWIHTPPCDVIITPPWFNLTKILINRNLLVIAPSALLASLIPTHHHVISSTQEDSEPNFSKNCNERTGHAVHYMQSAMLLVSWKACCRQNNSLAWR
jgi:hypothetical protein